MGAWEFIYCRDTKNLMMGYKKHLSILEYGSLSKVKKNTGVWEVIYCSLLYLAVLGEVAIHFAGKTPGIALIMCKSTCLPLLGSDVLIQLVTFPCFQKLETNSWPFCKELPLFFSV